MKETRTFSWCAIGVLLCSCTYPPWTRSYKGDGRLVDHGLNAADNRYVFVLGNLDFSLRESATFEIGRLPKEVFTIGFERVTLNLNGLGPIIRMRLVDTTNSVVVFMYEGEVSDGNGWFTSTPRGNTFLALLDDTDQVKESNPEEGHLAGSEFVPKRWHSYELDIAIVEPSPSMKAGDVVIRGGGWKSRAPSEY